MIKTERTTPSRNSPSRPIKSLLEIGMINSSTSVFDYGCGYGVDVKFLQSQGIKAQGWDLYHYQGKIIKADLVTLLYVLNVIADPKEREWVLGYCYEHALSHLIISYAPHQSYLEAHKTDYNDGYLTQWRTFEKTYNAEEFKNYLRAVLGIEPLIIPNVGNTYAVKINPKVKPIYAYCLSQENRDKLLINYLRQRSRLKQSWIVPDHVSFECINKGKHLYFRIRSPFADIPNPESQKKTKFLYLGNKKNSRLKWYEKCVKKTMKLKIVRAKINYLRGINPKDCRLKTDIKLSPPPFFYSPIHDHI